MVAEETWGALAALGGHDDFRKAMFTLLRELAPIEADLESGIRVSLRPVNATDIDRLERAYGLLSDESRLNRFWQIPAELDEARKVSLINTDERDHLAWIALDPENDDFPGYGAASFWRDRDDESRAEVAITIADAWQKNGLATLLFSVLWFEGWQLGIREFVGICRSQNFAMRSWWSSFGGGVLPGARHCELTFELTDPSDFLLRVPYEMPPMSRRVELAERLSLWLDLSAGG